LPPTDVSSPNGTVSSPQDSLFEEVDMNGDGAIDSEEFDCAFHNCWSFAIESGQDLKLDLATWDADQTSNLDEDQFTALCKHLVGALGKERYRELQEETHANIARRHVALHPVIHAIFHSRHKGFELGGRMGNVVTKVHGGQNSKVLVDTADAVDTRVLLERGWKAVAYDYRFVSGPALLEAHMAAQRAGQDCVITFEVTPDAARRLGGRALRQSGARLQLQDLLGRRSLQEIEQLPDETKRSMLRKFRMQWLMVDATAVMELEVLLGCKPAKLVQLSKDIHRCMRQGIFSQAADLIDEEEAEAALLQRDAGGNVPLHYCEDLDVARRLVARQPRAVQMKNLAQQAPIYTFLARKPHDAEALQVLVHDLGDLLRLDDKGVGPAMLTEGPARNAADSILSPWKDVEERLRLPAAEVLPALEELSPFWPELLSYHCFGEAEVFREGRHTKRTRARLRTLWAALEAALDGVLARDLAAAPVARALLEATKGPLHADLEPRQPYRAELAAKVRHLEARSARVLQAEYAGLGEKDSPAVKWLLGMTNRLSEEFAAASPGLRALELVPRLQMRLVPPPWVGEPDMKQISDDLQGVDMAGACDKSDTAYDLLCLAGTEFERAIGEKDLIIANWYAAWVRGSCQKEQGNVYVPIQEAIGPCVDAHEAAFSARKEAKGFPRICAKLLEYVREVSSELEARSRHMGPEEHQHVRTLVRQGVHFVCDINACTYVAKTPEELWEVCNSLESSTMVVARVKNGFGRNAEIDSAYRDLKIWLEHEAACGPLLIEVQLHLQSFFVEKKWMHLAYEVRRGSFDWPHVTASLTNDMKEQLERLAACSEGADPEALRDAIRKARCQGLPDADLREADARLEQLEAARALQEAMGSRCLKALGAALTRAQLACVEKRRVVEGEGLLAKLEVRKLVEQAVAERDLGALGKAVDKAAACGFESHEVYEVRQLVRSLRSVLEGGDDEAKMRVDDLMMRRDAQKNLSLAIEVRDVDMLTTAVANARAAKLAEHEVARAEALLLMRAREVKRSSTRGAEALRRIVRDSRRQTFPEDDPEWQVEAPELLSESEARKICKWAAEGRGACVRGEPPGADKASMSQQTTPSGTEGGFSRQTTPGGAT